MLVALFVGTADLLPQAGPSVQREWRKWLTERDNGVTVDADELKCDYGHSQVRRLPDEQTVA